MIYVKIFIFFSEAWLALNTL